MKQLHNLYDLLIVPFSEAGLLLLAGAAAMTVHKPLFFASLGPTAFELTETPERRSARPYSVIFGHLVGVFAGFVAIYVTGAWRAPAVDTYCITWVRVWAAVTAAILTVLGTSLINATKPAALSTTLMIATGSMQRLQDGPVIMASICLLTFAGEPLRRWRHSSQSAAPHPDIARVGDSSRLPERDLSLQKEHDLDDLRRDRPLSPREGP